MKDALHHIDTSIILEDKTNEDGFYCKKYLDLVGYKYKGVLSLPILSELMLKLLNLKELTEKYDFIESLNSLIKNKKIGIIGINATEYIVIDIKEKYPQITPNDRLIIATTIAYNIKTLVTLDNKLLRNKQILEEFDIKIVHPKYFFKIK